MEVNEKLERLERCLEMIKDLAYADGDKEDIIEEIKYLIKEYEDE